MPYLYVDLPTTVFLHHPVIQTFILFILYILTTDSHIVFSSKCIDCQPHPQLHLHLIFLSFPFEGVRGALTVSSMSVHTFINLCTHFPPIHNLQTWSLNHLQKIQKHHFSATFTHHVPLWYHQTSICCDVFVCSFVFIIIYNVMYRSVIHHGAIMWLFAEYISL